MPAWKRWLCAAAFMLGGGACAVWGVFDIAGWIDGLRRGMPVTTESVMLGLPLLGGGIATLGVLFLLPASIDPYGKPLTRLVGAALGAMVAGLVLVPIGSIAISIGMQYAGYTACAVEHTGRITATVWARPESACPNPT